MPKKKEKKRGDKPDEDKKTATRESPADEAGPGDREKDLYLIQIRYLNEELGRYQLRCDELERQKTDFGSQYSTLEKEKKDIVEYLKRSLLEKEDEAEELSERLQSQRRAADKDRDALQLQHSQGRKELQGRMEELTEENAALAAKLASLEEFQQEKEQLMSNLQSLQKQLASQEEEHKADMHSLEMKALLENKRLERVMEGHVAAMEAEVQHQVDRRVPETTRLALQENAEVKTRFVQLSEQAQALMKENTALQDRKSRLSVDVDILEEMLSEVSRKSCVRKKVVEQLTEKCRQLQAELKVHGEELQRLRSEHKDVLAETEALRQDRASLAEQGAKTRAEARRLEAELREERRRRGRMKGTMQEAAAALRLALMEEEEEEEEEAGVSVARWKQLMQRLLLVLDRPKLSGPGSEAPSKPRSCDPAAARVLTLDPALARCRPGDPGLAPRPAARHVLPRTGAGSSIPPLHSQTSHRPETNSSHSDTTHF